MKTARIAARYVDTAVETVALKDADSVKQALLAWMAQ